jgi:hypothetical protein
VLATNLELGANNKVFIRGQGGGLTWERGQPLAFIGGGVWVWSTDETNRIEFQLLLNDLIWERGETHVLERGGSIRIAPDFEWPEIPRTSDSAHHYHPLFA